MACLIAAEAGGGKQMRAKLKAERAAKNPAGQ
jgi:hypothetical protein